MTRNEGTTRQVTALATSRNAFSPGVCAGCVARATPFADALSGSAAAGMAQGAVLLVPNGVSVPADVIAETRRLSPARIEVLGGPGVVSPQMERTLKSLTVTVETIGGSDRFGTAAVASKLRFTTPTSAVIATGDLPGRLGRRFGHCGDVRAIAPVPGTCVPAYVLDRLHQFGVSSVTLLGGAGVQNS